MFEEMMQIFKGSFRRNWPFLGTIVICFTVMACTDPKDQARYDKQADEQKAIDADLTKKGFTQIGATPDGKPLYMKEISKGYVDDRVYFTDSTITAKEFCGKNCEKSITTVRH